MTTRFSGLLVLGLVVAIAGCGTPDGPSGSSTPARTDSPSATASGQTATARNIYDVPNFAPLEPGTYYIDPDKDQATPLQVLYTVPEGWSQWIGAFKGEEGAHRGVGVSITTVTNLVVDGCTDHAAADPPVGPTVDELAAALIDLAPFRVQEAIGEVTLAGYPGKHLALILPDVPREVRGDDSYYTGCTNGEIWSWNAPNLSDAFYGYQAPGQVEEIWILDVHGSRLVITGTWFAESPPGDIAEMRALLESIQIEP
jgi:hypothetical protein